MMKLLFGGTSDSIAILQLLKENNVPVTSSVVTDYGKYLASQFGQPVIQGRLSAEEMVSFIENYQVDEIIDATHPFAEIVSKEAMKAAELTGISYIRFERQSTSDLSGAIVVSSTQEAIDFVNQKHYKTVYLGTGSKTLHLFVEGLRDSRIVVRVLPTSKILLACEELGLVADQIDAIKAPFSKECNKELIRRSQADVFISKESGSVAGIREKIDACQELGVDCIIISRPLVNYPHIVFSIEELADYLNI